MYLYVPMHGSPNTELFANNVHDLLPSQDVVIMSEELQKQKPNNNSINELKITQSIINK